MTTSHLFSARIATLVAMRPRLQWLLIHRRAVLDHNTMWADARTGQYARLVDGLVSPLVRGGRKLLAVCFQFDAEHHLIVVHRELCLCMVLTDVGDHLDDTANTALTLLEECENDIRRAAGIEAESEDDLEPEVPLAEIVAEPEPEPEPDHGPAWNAYRIHLTEVIGKILSRPQAERLIARELTLLGIAGVPSPAEFERIGRDVVAHVPHRGKQAALLTEVLHFLES